MTFDAAAMADAIAARDRASIAGALNLVEDRRADRESQASELLATLRARKTAPRFGLTGPPGVGKSTLAAELAKSLRARGHTIGIVAVDPSSVRSGGSLLGDRARMAFDDEGVFVRSLATAGEAGGLARAAPAAVHVLAAGFDRVIVETTGVGQTETDVVHVADVVALVVQPGSGDVLQFVKAGIMEIPDVLVVHKADLDELSGRAVRDLRAAMRSLNAAAIDSTPVIATSAKDGRGIDALVDALEAGYAAIPDRDGKLRAGECAWALSLFTRKHGEHGIERLGGREAVAQKIEAEIDRGARAACEALSAEYRELPRG